jgi:chromate transporter
MAANGSGERPAAIGFGEAFLYWLKLGFISFGGPAGQISMMHQELVERRRWISEKRFLHALNYCMLLPGPEAQQLATYIGWMTHGILGGIVAGSLFVAPSFFILVALTWIYLKFGGLIVVSGALYGVKPAVTAIVLFSAYRIGSRALKNQVLWALAGAALLAIMLFNVPFPYIVAGAAAVGVIGGTVAPDKFGAGQGHSSSVKSYGPAVIDDDTPTPPHARFSVVRVASLALAGLTLWGTAIGILSLGFGWDGTLTQMGRFFTKAALMTFGGAYAVLPYVYQGGVEKYGWLVASQMMDGLALGETTPGPLIMVVTFVGFVGGWTKGLFGTDNLAFAGFAGATVATFFTFLPSFFFILAGGPLVESAHGNIKFTAPLTAITASVVGVIMNLALFFAYHTLWPKGFGVAVEWGALVIGAGAFLAIFRFKTDIIPVIIGSAAAGLIYNFTVSHLFS